MEVKDIIPTGKFTKTQLELLKMFSTDLPEEDWEEVRELLSKHFLMKARSEMDALFEEKGWGEEKIEEWSKEHMRTPYTK